MHRVRIRWLVSLTGFEPSRDEYWKRPLTPFTGVLYYMPQATHMNGIDVGKEQLKKILDQGGVLDVEGSRWIIDFWGRKNVAGILMMPITRHQVVHLNDALRIKGKYCGEMLNHILGPAHALKDMYIKRVFINKHNKMAAKRHKKHKKIFLSKVIAKKIFKRCLQCMEEGLIEAYTI